MRRLRARPVGAFGVALLAVGLGLSACGSGASNIGLPVPATESANPESGSTAGSTPALVAAANLLPCPVSDPHVAPVANGLPDVTLPCLGNGPPVRLAGLRGTPTVIPVWASWCEPCKTELPIFGDVARTAEGDVRFLGIDVADYPEQALSLAATTKMTIASVQDPNWSVRAPLRLIGPPTTYFVGSDGHIKGTTFGSVSSAAALKAQIHQYLNVTIQ